MNILFIVLGLVLLILISLRIWFWVIRLREVGRSEKIVEELVERNTLKLTKAEQFSFLDGNRLSSKVENILTKNKLQLSIIEYFIDVTPSEYLEYLRVHNPPSHSNDDLYGETKIKKEQNGYKIIYYDRGKKIYSKEFSEYDNLLKYLVYERLVKIGSKYKKILSKDYYT